MHYTDEQKARALELLETESVWAATAELGCSHVTVYRWHAQHVRTLNKTDEDEAEEVALQVVLRNRLRRRLLETALSHVDRSDSAASAKDAREFMTAAAIAVDKYRLELGEHTARTDSYSSVDMELQRRIDEWKRQHADA